MAAPTRGCLSMVLLLVALVGAHAPRGSRRLRGTLNATRGPRSAPADRRRLAAYNYLQVAKLRAADGASNDNFGYSVATDGDTVVVGARYDDDGGASSGSAYVFDDESGWWDYFSSDAATRRLPQAMILLAAAAVLAAILA